MDFETLTKNKGHTKLYDVLTFSLESGKAVHKESESQTVNIQTQGHIVDMKHFDTGNITALKFLH